MLREVVLTEDAERDLEDLYQYIAEFDLPKKADHVLDRLLEVAETLAAHPERGSLPRELQALGIQEYRQVFFKPYRVIYRIMDKQVVIYLIADGRRDMQTLLTRRLLGG
jgi:toxin ParE1/3/4